MKTDTLLVEVRTEELPPPAVRVLAEKFPHELLNRLRDGGFTESQTPRNGMFATPRRFAALIDGVQERAKDRKVARRGPQVKDGLDAAGKSSPALRGFMRAVGVTDVTELAREKEKGREYFVWRGEKPGAALADVLPQMVTDSMCAMPDLPSMRWNADDYAFVRPVRGLVMMLGGDIISDKEVMGAKSGNETRGHPVLAEKTVRFERAEYYADTLRKANVIADYNERDNEREKEFTNLKNRMPDMASFAFGGKPGFINEEYQKLVNEVTAMCEKPSVHEGEIDKEFWQLPPDCVASCLIRHQKCFPCLNDEGDGLALSRFFFVADNESKNINIATGVNAVVRARLQDLKFYLQKDKKLTEKEAAEKLDGIVYHRKLGSQRERANRIVAIADSVGKIMKLNKEERDALKRAAEVCKLDLPTMIVAEYPELAGKMAAYYFCGGDSRENLMARSIVERHGNDDFEVYVLSDKSELPAIALFLADKLEKITGMFLVGEKPAGRKDPHGLRRAAGQIADIAEQIAAILVVSNRENPGLEDMSDESAERVAKLSLKDLLKVACNSFGDKFDTQKINVGEVREFISKRALPGNYDVAVLNAVRALRLDYIAEIPRRCEALQEFLEQREEAPLLIVASKRINNFLQRPDAPENPPFAEELLQESAEKALHECVVNLENKKDVLLSEGKYEELLTLLADKAADPVREFFDKVMVNAEDDELRANRLALLIRLRAQLNSVADLARLRVLSDNYDAAVLNAVDLRLECIAEIPRRCKALQEFLRRDEASVLVAANKRINNILRKSDTPKVLSLSPGSLKEPEERALYQCLVNLEEETQRLWEKDDYQGMLSVLATKAADPVREFFDKVMVNTDDEKLRHNRLALLSDLQKQLNKVADLEHLSAPK